jgi:hypothetical protein
MPIKVFFIFSIPILYTLFILMLLWPVRKYSTSLILLVSSLAIGLGMGICSSLFFLYLLCGGTSSTGLAILESICFLVLLTTTIHNEDIKDLFSNYEIFANGESNKIRNTLLGFFILLIAIHLFVFISRSLSFPFGEGDGWTIWNTHARFLFRGNEHWRDVVNPLLRGLPDYPLLIPGAIARGWKYLNNGSPVIPIIIHLLFNISVVGLLFSSITLMRNQSQGLLAAIVLLGTYNFIELSSGHYADIPLSFFFLATTVFFCLQDKFPDARPGLLFLTGLSAALAAWTKNEGLLFVLSVFSVHFLVTIFRHGWKVYFTELIYFGLGLIIVLGIVFYFKFFLAPKNVLVSGMGQSRLFDISRYLMVSQKLLSEFISWNDRIFRLPYFKYISSTMVMSLYLLLLGIRVDKAYKNSLTIGALVLLTMGIGYFFVYILTPYPLQWHLDTSVNRLFVQLWPSFLFLYFMVARTPEEALAAGSSSHVKSPDPAFCSPLPTPKEEN